MTNVSALHEQATRLGCIELASRLGFRVRGSYARARGACPVHGGHNDQTFSLTLKDGALIAHCFGCGFAGDVIALVGALRGVADFRAQVDATIEVLNMAPIPERAPEQTTNAPPIDAISYHNVVTALVVECRKHRRGNDVAQYLRSRGILDIVPEYGLFPLPQRDRHRSIIDALLEQFELDTLVAAGLIWQTKDGRIVRDALSFARNRLCIPWRGPDWRVEALQRRVLDSSNPRYVFPRGIKAMHPFGVEKLRDVASAQSIALVEGALDAISLAAICRREGFDIVPLGLPGVDGWRDAWGQYCEGRTVYIAFDADEAGMKAFADLAPVVRDAGASEVRWWQPERGKDWNEELVRVAS